ncbi:MAG: radical SAM family heme chaperone HemW [Bacilli bacterium]|nr:radical SAM family heme chaperone HemW [Bacilli bacterium]
MIKYLYIHIPFCDHICSYCDFYKMIAKEEVITKYIEYLKKELELKKDYLKDIIGIYIGGGTPSSIGINNLKLLFTYLFTYININTIKEFSIECNPKDINNKLLDLFNEYKVNRVSLGVQSLNAKKLALMRRNHNKKDVIYAIKSLQNKFIYNINVDLLYAFPRDDFQGIKRDIKTLIKLNIPHFSCYSLILEEKTILYNQYKNNEFKLFDPDQEAKLYYKIQKYLNKHEYFQYEISNFSKKGYECQYNLNTGDNNEYLGIGASASYYIGNNRYYNYHNLNKYFHGIDSKQPYFDVCTLTNEDKMYEEIMLGLRKIKGINVKTFYNKYKMELLNKYPKINYLIEKKFLIKNGNYIAISPNKLYLENSIIGEILD